jgi:hypothetical protein
MGFLLQPARLFMALLSFAAMQRYFRSWRTSGQRLDIVDL